MTTVSQPRKRISVSPVPFGAALRRVPGGMDDPLPRQEQWRWASTPPDRPRHLESANGGRPSPEAITLLELEPDLRRLLAPEQRAAAEQFLLPLVIVEKNSDVSAVIKEAHAFGALVLDGLLVQSVQLGDHETLRLIGPGALAPVEPHADGLPGPRSDIRAADHTCLVLLGKAFLIATQRWPQLVVCLHERMLAQSAHLTEQLAISQLPRVEHRIVAMLKLLAESWGKVTPVGIRVELPLTHEVLGGLIGARRPTVSLALKALAEQKSVVRNKKGWLITAA